MEPKQDINTRGTSSEIKENPLDKTLKSFSRFIGRVDQKLSKIKFFQSLPVVQRRILIIVGMVFFSFVAFVIFFGIIYKLVTGRTPSLRINPKSEITSVTPPPKEVRNPSKYASDPKVLELESKVKDLNSKANETDIDESTLSVPPLNFEVEF